MNDEKWADLKEKVETRFGKFDQSVEEVFLEDDLGHKIPQRIEALEFASGMGLLKIERISHPRILDRKAHYHKGAGGADVEYITSEDEFTYKINVYKKDDVTGEWVTFNLEPERLNF